MKKLLALLILLTIVPIHAEEDGLDSKQIWTSLLVNTVKVGDFQHKVYTESWNDVEEGVFLWLISNKFVYSINKEWNVAFNHTFLDIQSRKNPHQHRFEFESNNTINAWATFGIRNRLERRWNSQVEEGKATDYRYRLQISATLPAFTAVPWLKLYMSDEMLLDTKEFGDYFTDFRETYNENRWTILGLAAKVNDNISVKVYPAIRFKASTKNVWSETGVLGILLINTF